MHERRRLHPPPDAKGWEDAAREAVYRTMLTLLRDDLELEHSAEKLGLES